MPRRREPWEREQIRAKMLRTRTVRVREGRHAGGRVPFGYQLLAPAGDARLVINEEQAAIVRRIFSARIAGMSYRSIANALNADNVPSPTHAQWGESSVRMLANNPVYSGIQRRRDARGAVVQGVCPAIITPEEFAAAMRRSDAGGRNTGGDLSSR